MARFCTLSMTPVIEALSRLEVEGLVESHPYYGSRVVEIRSEDLEQVYAMREAIEAQSVRILCFTLSPLELKHLEKQARNLDDLAGKEHEPKEFDRNHHQFHRQLVFLTGNPFLLDGLDRIHFYDLLSRSESSFQALDIPQDQYSHQDIIQAIALKEADTAARLIRQHIYRAGLVEKPWWVV